MHFKFAPAEIRDGIESQIRALLQYRSGVLLDDGRGGTERLERALELWILADIAASLRILSRSRTEET